MRRIKTASVTILILAFLVASVLFFMQITHKPGLKSSNDKENNLSSVQTDTESSPYYHPPENPLDEKIVEQSPIHSSINETIVIPYVPSIVDAPSWLRPV